MTIENSTLRGRGHLIVCNTRHADITIRNTRGLGLNPNVAGKAAGRFATIERFDRVVGRGELRDAVAPVLLERALVLGAGIGRDLDAFAGEGHAVTPKSSRTCG